MVNFLKETEEVIFESGHTWEDVDYIGSNPHGEGPYYSCTVEEFHRIADFDYDNGYGGQYIATDLIILFSDGIYMVRGEYDGSEWWEYNKPVENLPKETKKITVLVHEGFGGWETIKEMHDTEE